MLSRVLSTIHDHCLVARRDRVLVAVSGGPDSIALLHALARLAGRLDIELEAATVDHAIRPGSAADAAAAAAEARSLGISATVLAVDVAAARRQGHGSWQDAARRARLGALAELAEKRGCRRVALGHHGDDQAETILFRILRGTGLRGLGGIPYRRDPFIRPLLDVRRAEILRFLAKRGIGFVEDPSNADPRFARARIRHRILPALRAENPRLEEALLSLGAEASRLPAGAAPPPGELHLGRGSRETVLRLAALGRGTRRVDVAGAEVEIRYGAVTLRRRAGGMSPLSIRPPPAPVVVDRPGIYRPPGLLPLRIDEVPGRDPGRRLAAAFDAERIGRPLVIRAVRPGDRMFPRGGRGSRKLQDLLVDAKVPRPERATLPVLAASDGTVLFVPGLRPSQVGRPTTATRVLLFVERDGDVASKGPPAV